MINKIPTWVIEPEIQISWKSSKNIIKRHVRKIVTQSIGSSVLIFQEQLVRVHRMQMIQIKSENMP